ncbi:Pimeloyl-ACP methyl ester carboxylesterase [Sulfitobacter brevis]|uniref:Pimeloyl-ACP methyl ester carboxylesterase n=1 Tax=Sulfitobacter brevis TaxID=74348 RepID=A0A1I2F1T8_9RHOB|nr:alpha/beta hydrolase [Sulfitobacter brevis]SFE98491.1 Pimeloyl-ACP methyl ester carboxylesterase [Sulfitobacter brevis]
MGMHPTIQRVCPIHIEAHGDIKAPCVVLVLGLGMQVVEWPTGFIKKLSEQFYVVCIENRDMGRSGRCGPDMEPELARFLVDKPRSDDAKIPYTLFDMRDDVLRAVDRLGVEKFAIVGFSMGGMIAQLVAAQPGQRVTAFAQICSSGGEASAPFSPDAYARLLAVTQVGNSKAELIEMLARDLIWFLAPSRLSKDEAKDLAAMMLETGFTPGGYARQLLAIQCSGDRSDDLRSIQAPAIIIGARQDRCLSLDGSNRAFELIPHAEFKVFDGMGHSLEPAALDYLTSWLCNVATAVAQKDNRRTDHGMA